MRGLRERILTQLSEINNLFYSVAPEILLQYYLDITVVSCRFNAIMQGRQAESHIINVEKAKACIFPIHYFNRTSFIIATALVDYEKVMPGKNKFFESF